eukprot:TRINITY_DN3525_c0_g3_i2.p1 TRINITY_DN3525_c0_g3~~TRINITY_DN3525_c0_g3_i2.p1  ORF type:complete len:283 (+),score=63.58 TRINITY_DN3525_c0_g3_i2:86-934(+)
MVDIREKIKTWKLPVLIVSVILSLIGAALKWAGSGSSQSAANASQVSYVTALFFFVPLFNAFTHFTGKTYGLFVALGIFFFHSPSLMANTHNDISNNIDEGTRKLIAGNVLLLLGNFLSFIVYPFPQTPVLVVRYFVPGFLIVVFNFIACIIFWNLLNSVDATYSKNDLTLWTELYFTTPVQMFYVSILFVLAMLGSKSSQVMTVFLGGFLLYLLNNTLNSENYGKYYSGSEVDQLRAAHAIYWISLVLMILYILFFTSFKSEEADHDFNSLYSDEPYESVK